MPEWVLSIERGAYAAFGHKQGRAFDASRSAAACPERSLHHWRRSLLDQKIGKVHTQLAAVAPKEGTPSPFGMRKFGGERGCLLVLLPSRGWSAESPARAHHDDHFVLGGAVVSTPAAAAATTAGVQNIVGMGQTLLGEMDLFADTAAGQAARQGRRFARQQDPSKLTRALGLSDIQAVSSIPTAGLAPMQGAELFTEDIIFRNN